MAAMNYDPLDWLDGRLKKLKSDHLFREPGFRSEGQGVKIRIGRQHVLNFGSNDYLGLASDHRLASAASAGISEHGWGSGSSPLITGRTDAQVELERNLAQFENTEASIVFPSGFAANVGTLACLVERGDVIFSDALNHASLIDGCRLSRADVQVYAHCDVADLNRRLMDAGDFRRRFIVTDTLFSMDGDLAPIPGLLELAERYRAVLVVDEAHATGVFGTGGRGVCEHFDVHDAVPVRIGTLSKALGSVGGFVAGQRRLIDWLFNRARTHVFSTALPAAAHYASTAALQIARDEPSRRTRLLQDSGALRDALKAQDWAVGDSQSQIIPIILGDPQRAIRMAQQLRDRGFFVPAIRPPTVPRGQSMLRLSLTHGVSPDVTARLLDALADIRRAGPSG